MLKSVAVIVVRNFSIFEFATACEVFGIDRSERGSNVLAFDFRVCTPQPGDVRMKSGLSMNVSLGLDATADADLVIMTPFGRNEDVPESVLEALGAADARGRLGDVELLRSLRPGQCRSSEWPAVHHPLALFP
ncbi:UNVERIFIED_ORG: transcriptional regulator GlxA family with amidase domain [Arthrobacter sp. UYEF13]